MSFADLPPHIRQLAHTQLTPRQLHIIQARLNGQSLRTIATDLNIDESTVRGHYQRATRKLAHHWKEPDA